jgi:hypothetical protein
MVGRADLLPATAAHHTATLRVDVKGARPHQVQVSVSRGRDKKADSRVGTVVAIGSAVLVLLGAIIWFVVQVLPLLVP